MQYIVSLSEMAVQTYAALSVTENIVLVRPAFGRPFIVSEMKHCASEHSFVVPTAAKPFARGRGQRTGFGAHHFNHFAAPCLGRLTMLIRGGFARKGL